MTPHEVQTNWKHRDLRANGSQKSPGATLLGLPGFRWDEVAATSKRTIDLEGRLIKDGVRKAIGDRQNALHELLNAVNQYRKLLESKPLTLQGSDYAHAVLELNEAIAHAEGLLLQ